MHFRSAIALTALLGAAAPAASQIPDSIATSRADSLSGLYRSADGHFFHLLNLSDQLNGRSVLSLTDFATGELRALYPTAREGFEFGPGWFDRTPVHGSVRFSGGNSAFERSRDGVLTHATRVPLVEREVRVQSDGVTLVGTLVLPPGKGPFPAVLMIQGSGPTTRRSPRMVGDLAAAHGIAVLSMDKRGTGASGGEWAGLLAHDQWRDDVSRELDVLMAQPEIDRSRVGIFAGSEGGFIGPAVAARRGDVAFLVCRVCAALPHGETIQDMEERRLLAAGRSPAVAAQAREWLRLRQHYAVHRTGYDTLRSFERSTTNAIWRDDFPPGQRTLPAVGANTWNVHASVLRGDPRDDYQALDIPVLILNGGDDQRILTERHTPRFEQIASTKRDFTVRIIPNASHGLLLEGADGVQSYPRGMFEGVVEWMLDRVRGEGEKEGNRKQGTGLP